MDESHQREKIIVPALQITKLIEPLHENIVSLSKQAASVNIYNPLTAVMRLRRIYISKLDIRYDYDALMAHCYKTLSEPVNQAPGLTAGYLQAWSTSMGLQAILKLQDAWKDLDATVDRKTAFSVATVAMYVSIVSLVATVLFGYASLK